MRAALHQSRTQNRHLRLATEQDQEKVILSELENWNEMETSSPSGTESGTTVRKTRMPAAGTVSVVVVLLLLLTYKVKT